MAYPRNTAGTTADGMLDALTTMTAKPTAKGYRQLTGLSAVKTLANAGGGIPSGSAYAIIQAVGANVRWTDDGTVPTASFGMQLQAGKELPYDGDLTVLKFIEEAASAQINVSFYA
jgi:hypothetical protein